MKLIAESGSTKTDWVAFSNNSGTDIQFRTAGLNPHVLSTSAITKQLFESDQLKSLVTATKHIYFYGAGCSSLSMKKSVKDALRAVFPTTKIDVHHDLDAAVRSTWTGEKAITSILGTGSNCCLFDGKEIVQHKPSLGHLLGDEGSGNHMGGNLYRAIAYKEAPKEIIDSFYNEFEFQPSELVTLLYAQNKPNEFLASFLPFVKTKRDHLFIKSLIIESFDSFVNTHIKSFDDHQHVPCHFVGSIAHHFQPELKEVLESNGLIMGTVLQSPLEGLVNYHKR